MANAYLCNISGNPMPIVDAVTGAALASKTFTGVSTNFAATSPNGQWLAVVGAGTHIQFMDLNTLGLSATFTFPAGNPGGLVWHPDSSKVWVGTQGQVHSVTPAGTFVNSATLANVNSGAARDVVISPDGTKLYCTGLDGVYQVDTTTLGITYSYPIVGFSTTGLCITGDGAHLYATDNHAPGTVYRIDVTSSIITASVAVNDRPNGLCLSPDGSTLWVACAGGAGGLAALPAVHQISTSSFTVVNTITTGWTQPTYTAIDPTGVVVWVADNGNHNSFPVTVSTLSVGTGIYAGGPIAIGTPGGSSGGGITGGIRGSLALGPLTLAASGTITGSGTGAGTVTGSGIVNLGPVTVVARTTLEVVTGSAAVGLGPLVVVAVSGRVGPHLHPVPGFRGRWRLTLHNRTFTPATLGSTIIAELADARGRRLEQAWNTPATLTFTLDGHSQSAGLVQELLQDVVAWRWDDQTGLEWPVFRGPICQSEDQLSTESHTVTYICHDYAALLTRRLLTNTYTVTGRDQDLIVADLLNLAVAARTSAGGSLAPASFLPLSLYTANGASSLRGLSGALRDRTYYGSQNIGDAFDALAKVLGGFDYDVRPSPVDTTDSLRIFYPQQGVTRGDGIALQYGSTVASLTRSINSADYANYVRVLGNNTSANPTPQFYAETATPGVATSPAGLWMLGDDAADVTVQATLNDKAAGDLNLDALLVPHYTLGLTPDAYTWGNPNMGDTVPLIVNSGRLNVNTSVRVLGIGYTIGDDGQEDVTLTVSRPANELYKLFTKADRDTKALARR